VANRRWRLARIWSNEVLRSVAPLFTGSILNLSGWKDDDKQGGKYREYFKSAQSYYVSNYQGVRGTEENVVTDFFVDLTAESLPGNLIRQFDVVYNHTTLEHIFDVRLAFRNLCQMSSDIVIVIVPFAQCLHFTESYGDYWRFTPMSMRHLFHDNGFEVIFEAASPHRDAAVYLFFVGSHQPEKWQGKLPPWEPVESLGDWIGSDPPNLKQRTRRIMVELIRKAKSHLQSLLIS